MIEITCQSCQTKVGVQSLLAAAQQPCDRCGGLLMGALAQGPRTARPAGFAEPPPPRLSPHARVGQAWLWLGMLAGALSGVAVVGAVAAAGPVMALPARGAVLGALAGALLTPFIAMSGFLAMLILPISLEGLIGDSLWTRLATALHHRRFRPLFLPLLIYLVLPMALCGLGGSRSKTISEGMVVVAGLGALGLGAVVGGIGGSIAGRIKRGQRATLTGGLDDAFRTPVG